MIFLAKTSVAPSRSMKDNRIPSDLTVRDGKLRERTGKWFFLMLALTIIELMLFASLVPHLEKEYLTKNFVRLLTEMSIIAALHHRQEFLPAVQ